MQTSNPNCLFRETCSGTFTGTLVRLISNIRDKHGRDAVNLDGCGRFDLAEDLSDIADVTHIDLSKISSLHGKDLFFLSYFVDSSRSHHSAIIELSSKLPGDIAALGNCTNLMTANFYGCENITGKFLGNFLLS